MSARLSPAANLLRNSKLFALPAAIPLPATPPSSDQVANSETATSLYPQYAAIKTPTIALNQGDWGFKRALPAKSTTKTGHPVVRLVRGIDTPEHTADFESAADHVLTLRKFSELHQPIRHMPIERGGSFDGRDQNVFRHSHDNTTSNVTALSHPSGSWPNLPAPVRQAALPEAVRQTQEQYDAMKATESSAAQDPASKPQTGRSSIGRSQRLRENKRWRYAGPSLVQQSGLEFDSYLTSLGDKEIAALRERVRQEIARDRQISAREDGQMAESGVAISEEDVDKAIRYLRNNPHKFGPMLTELLDIPEGTVVHSRSRTNTTEAWEYGRSTLATPAWATTGPPTTHPSAGLSYIHTSRHAANHPSWGAQDRPATHAARAVKHRLRLQDQDAIYGLAGFIVPKPEVSSRISGDVHRPRPGGGKVPLQPIKAYVNEKGALIMDTLRGSNHRIVNDVATHEEELRQAEVAEYRRKLEERNSEPRMPQLSTQTPETSHVRERKAGEDTTNDILGRILRNRSR